MRVPDANPVFILGITTLADGKGWSQAQGDNESINRSSGRREEPKRRPKRQCDQKAGRLAFAIGLTLTMGLTRLAFGSPKSVPRGETTPTEAASMSVNRPNKGSRPRVILRIYNYVHLPPRPLMTAEHEAESILAAAGLEARWVDCPTSELEEDRYPLCAQEMPPVTLVLNILPDTMLHGAISHQDALGLALSCPHEATSCFAYIFYDRIQDWVRQGGTVPSYEILGRTIAHEVGHLLLGPDSHSLTGIMRAAWSPDDLEPTTGGSQWSVLFTAAQAKRMRTELTRWAAGQE